MAKEESLSVREMLERVYHNIGINLQGEQLTFLNPLYVAISNDCRWQQDVFGELKYETMMIVRGQRKIRSETLWAIVHGRANGDDRQNPFGYDSDIALFPFVYEEAKSQQRMEQLITTDIAQGENRNAIYGMNDGRLTINRRSTMGRKLSGILGSKVSRCIAEPWVFDEKILTTNACYAVKQQARYKPELVEFITYVLCSVMINQ